MSKFHNTEEAEKTALAWHWFGALVALGGLIFHLLAVREHKEHLKELERDET